jgi:hypothetical protein
MKTAGNMAVAACFPIVSPVRLRNGTWAYRGSWCMRIRTIARNDWQVWYFRRQFHRIKHSFAMTASLVGDSGVLINGISFLGILGWSHCCTLEYRLGRRPIPFRRRSALL